MATYYAVTTLGNQDWELIGEADSRESAEALCPETSINDIYQNTRCANFRVWTKTFAQKVMGRAGFREWCYAECERKAERAEIDSENAAYEAGL
jgi:hypothetical protein